MGYRPAISLLDVINMYSFSWNYFVKGVKSTLDYSGKADRKDYWGFWVCYWTILPLFAFLINSIGISFGPFGVIFGLPALSITVRRLRDLNYPVWLTVPFVLPFIGFILSLIFFTKPSPSWERPADYSPWWEGKSFFFIVW